MCSHVLWSEVVCVCTCVHTLLWCAMVTSGVHWCEETDAGERVKVESKLDKRVQVRPHPHYSCHVTTPTHRTLSH